MDNDKLSAEVREALDRLRRGFREESYGPPGYAHIAKRLVKTVEAELHRLTAALAEQTALREKAEAEVARWRERWDAALITRAGRGSGRDIIVWAAVDESLNGKRVRILLDEPPQDTLTPSP